MLNLVFGPPYPSTPVFKDFKDKIMTKNFENFTQYHLVYKHDILDEKTVKSFRKLLSKVLF